MCRFSSKSSLLAGVSAVVLAASVGSGAFAQAVTYEHSTGGDAWANDIDRADGSIGGNDGSTDMGRASAGDNLRLSGGYVETDRAKVGRRSMGALFSGSSGAGELRISNSFTIGRIGKYDRVSRAVDIAVDDGRANVLVVENDAELRNLKIPGAGGAKFGGDLTIDGGVALGGTAYLIFNGSADQRILGSGTAKITTAADGLGRIEVLNGVSGAAPRKATFDIEIGAPDKRLTYLGVGDSSKGGHAIFNDAVHVDGIEVIAGDGTREDGIAEFRGDVSGSNITLNGDGNSAKVIFNALNGDITIDAAVSGDDSGDGLMTIIGGRSFAGRRNKVTFNREIGGGSDALYKIVIGDGTTGDAVFKDNVKFLSASIRDSGRMTLEKSMGGPTGSLLQIGNSAYLTIGGAGRLATVNDAGQTINNRITAGGDGQGTLIVDNRGDAGTGRTSNNKVTFSGSVGADGTALGQITLRDGRTTFNSGVYADTITITTGDATVFKGHVKAGTGASDGIKLGATSGSVTFNGTAGQTVAGNITTATPDRGEITVDNKAGVTFENDLGTAAARLGLLTLTGHATAANASRATFKGNVYLKTGANGGLVLGQNTSVRFAPGRRSFQTVVGNITSASGGNYGGISISNGEGVTFKGNLGTSGAKLNSLALGRRSRVTLEGHVYLANGLKLDDESLITFGGSANQTIQAGIGNSRRDRRGSVVVDNDGTTNRTVSFEDAVGASGAGNDLARLTVRDGVAVFKGDVFAQGLEVSSTDGAEFKGNVTTGGISFAGNDAAQITLNGAANQTVTGDITTESNGRGRLVVDNRHATNNKVTFGGRAVLPKPVPLSS